MDKVYETFEIGKSYPNKTIKSLLKEIFSGSGVCVKATDLKKYFEIFRAQIKDPATNKYIEGLKIIKKLK